MANTYLATQGHYQTRRVFRFDVCSASAQIMNGLGAGSAALFLASAITALAVSYELYSAAIRFALLGFGLAVPVFLIGRARQVPVNTLLRVVQFLLWAILLLGLLADMGDGVNLAALAEAPVVILPLATCGLLLSLLAGDAVMAFVAAAVFAIGLLFVYIEPERGVLLALGIGTVAGASVYLLARFQRRWRRIMIIVALALTAVCAGVYGAFLLSTTALAYGQPFLPAVIVAKFRVWHAFIPLILDYRFTGSGLSGSEMVYSTYLFLLHVPYLYHAHNLFIQVAVEQGTLALIGLVGMSMAAMGATLLVSYRARLRQTRIVAAATTAALVGTLALGGMDSELYASPYVAFQFVPIGLAWALNFARFTDRMSPAFAATGTERTIVSTPSKRRVYLTVIGTLLPWLGLVWMFLLPGAQAHLHANIGAVLQTRTELAAYEWSRWSLQDEVRRSPGVNLTPAMGYYLQALERAADESTANRRLGQIYLSLGKYDVAESYLTKAYLADPESSVVGQLLGEIRALQGQTSAALAFWRPVGLRQEQLMVRYRWHQSLGEVELADRLLGAILWHDRHLGLD